MHEDEKGDWVPNNIIVSPREGKQVVLVPDFLSKVVLFVPKTKTNLRRKKILTHIRSGERRGFHKRPTCSSRKSWYKLEKREPWPILHPMIHNERQVVLFNKYGVQVDHNLFEIKPKNDENTTGILCFFLSTVGMLIKEFGGRTNLGQGALKTEGIDIEKLLVLKDIPKKNRNALNKFLENNPTMEIESIFNEVGTSPEEISLEKIRPDRRALDKIIMGDILGLTDEDQIEVYKAVVDLVKSRIDKAKSVKKKGKIQEGVDIEQLSRVVMDKIGKGTYRKFYEEKVLSRKELKMVKLLSPTKKPIAENTLFGWRVVADKHFVDCANEEEARYLKVWLDAGLTEEVKEPTDEKYLKRILPELEELHANISRIISEHLESITSQKLRNQIIHHLQRKLFV